MSATLPHNTSDATTSTSTRRMPSLFVGHGSPMNALDNNAYTQMLKQWGEAIGRPAAILVVSAHWLTRGEVQVTSQAKPETIHDFGGFPRDLYAMQYPAPGSPAGAGLAVKALQAMGAKPTLEWGLDHGAWTVLHHMYPEANIPVFQVSIDYAQNGDFHVAAGQALSTLRDQGVLILGSGNVVHNLSGLDFGAPDSLLASRPWAQSFDQAVKTALVADDRHALANYLSLDDGARMSVPSPDHYWPLLYALGAARADEPARFVYEGFQMGTLSMRCVQWG